jgi:hypothetical protein
MTIASNKSGVLASSIGPCGSPPDDQCVELNGLKWTLSADHSTLSATVPKVSFVACHANGQVDRHAPANVSLSDVGANVGDSFHLVFVNPHVMVRTIIHGMSGFVGGIPRWCAKNFAESRYCGA